MILSLQQSGAQNIFQEKQQCLLAPHLIFLRDYVFFEILAFLW